ncbi:MATE family efflux transporter [Angelakisella massiliensis]|uniref:MATE family efflux transporter n=1 Tax=Angelakisella massiliensis TaxID=1871018 RepID=UPI0023A807D4|nr:MATE family efflux transporter [Angelakisella massiliensis]
MARENDLGRDSIPGLVLRLAIPAMLAQFVNVLYSIVDRIFIGNIPVIGGDALAGAGICAPVVTLISSFALLAGMGGAPLMAIRMGEGNQEGARKILANCAALLLGLAVGLTVLFLIFKKPLLMAFGASAATYPYADTYMTIYTLGAVFAILATGLNLFITCQGYATMSMLTVIIGAVVNIVLDPIFIFGLNMGVAGAAIATVIAQGCSCAFVLRTLLSSGIRVRLSWGGYDRKLMKRVMIFGLSPFLISSTDSVVIIAFNSVLQRFGGAEQGDLLVTCATIVMSFMQLITMPMMGITSGTQPILSFNYGAKKIQRIRDGEKMILMLAVAFAVVMFTLAHTIPHVFVRIFSSDPKYLDLSVWGIRVYTACVIPMAFQYTFVDGLTALGIPKAAVTLSLFRKLVLLLLTFLLPVWFGAKSAFFSEPAADLLCGTISTITFLMIFGKVLKRRMEMPDGASVL